MGEQVEPKSLSRRTATSSRISRGWICQDGYWFKSRQDSIFRVTFRKERESQLFSPEAPDCSELQLQEALRFCEHILYDETMEAGFEKALTLRGKILYDDTTVMTDVSVVKGYAGRLSGKLLYDDMTDVTDGIGYVGRGEIFYHGMKGTSFKIQYDHSEDSASSRNCKDFLKILGAANHPVPSLEILFWRGRSAAISKAIKSKKMSLLRSLKIHDPAFKVKALATAIESGCLPQLKILNLRFNDRHVHLAKVMQAGHMPLLEELGLSACQMTPLECEAYAGAFRAGKLPSLTLIDFSSNERIGIRGAQALGLAIQSGGLRTLTDLNLECCKFRDEEMLAILKSFCVASGSSVANLRRLNFRGNPFTDLGFCALADVLSAGHLDCLRELDLRESAASRTGAAALVSALASNILLNVTVHFEWDTFGDLRRHKDQLMRSPNVSASKCS